jgi:acetyl/propionyl-CoA carboxylase alpha subunit
VRFEVTHGRDTFKVEVKELGPDLLQVRIGEEPPVAIDVRKTPRTIYSLLIDGRQFEGSVDERDDGTFDVHVGSGAFEFSVVDERRKLLVGTGAHVQAGKQTLRAQMPGKIVKILVAVGDRVEAEQGLMVIEAMKMENELRSPIQGVVTEIGVAEGEAVETRALLIVIEPPEPA